MTDKEKYARKCGKHGNLDMIISPKKAWPPFTDNGRGAIAKVPCCTRR